MDNNIAATTNLLNIKNSKVSLNEESLSFRENIPPKLVVCGKKSYGTIC